jgi:hypothetical protein
LNNFVVVECCDEGRSGDESRRFDECLGARSLRYSGRKT